MIFGKVLTAMVTPFDNRGNVDFNKTTELINYLLDHGTDGLVVAGTTGESPTLSTEEKLALFQHVVQVVNGRVPVIAGTGSNNTHASIDLTKKAEKAGVDGIMLVTPYYNKPSQEGMFYHFSTIAESTQLPIMLYNIPGRSAVNMDVDTVIRLSQVSNIVAIKEASGNLDAMSSIIENTDDDFILYSGDDTLTLPILAIGGKGVVSVVSHVIGDSVQDMVQLFEQGRVEEAAALHRKLLPIIKSVFMAPSPSPIKTALQIKGLDVGGVRLPLVPLTAEQRQQLLETLNQ
ncbi:4-hydroxy-tetrahydrodipicolinate synthase [Bacillaceae bacterium S4-13-56]